MAAGRALACAALLAACGPAWAAHTGCFETCCQVGKEAPIKVTCGGEGQEIRIGKDYLKSDVEEIYIKKATSVVFDTDALSNVSKLRIIGLTSIKKLYLHSNWIRVSRPNIPVSLNISGIDELKIHKDAFSLWHTQTSKILISDVTTSTIEELAFTSAKVDNLTLLNIFQMSVTEDAFAGTIGNFLIRNVTFGNCFSNTFSGKINNVCLQSVKFDGIKGNCMNASQRWGSLNVQNSTLGEVKPDGFRGTIDNVFIENTTAGSVEKHGFHINVSRISVKNCDIGELVQDSLNINASMSILLLSNKVHRLRRNAFRRLLLGSSKNEIVVSQLEVAHKFDGCLTFHEKSQVSLSEITFDIPCSCNVNEIARSLVLGNDMKELGDVSDDAEALLQQAIRALLCKHEKTSHTLASYHCNECDATEGAEGMKDWCTDGRDGGQGVEQEPKSTRERGDTAEAHPYPDQPQPATAETSGMDADQGPNNHVMGTDQDSDHHTETQYRSPTEPAQSNGGQTLLKYVAASVGTLLFLLVSVSVCLLIRRRRDRVQSTDSKQQSKGNGAVPSGADMIDSPAKSAQQTEQTEDKQTNWHTAGAARNAPDNAQHSEVVVYNDLYEASISHQTVKEDTEYPLYEEIPGHPTSSIGSSTDYMATLISNSSLYEYEQVAGRSAPSTDSKTPHPSGPGGKIPVYAQVMKRKMSSSTTQYPMTSKLQRQPEESRAFTKDGGLYGGTPASIIESNAGPEPTSREPENTPEDIDLYEQIPASPSQLSLKSTTGLYSVVDMTNVNTSENTFEDNDLYEEIPASHSQPAVKSTTALYSVEDMADVNTTENTLEDADLYEEIPVSHSQPALESTTGLYSVVDVASVNISKRCQDKGMFEVPEYSEVGESLKMKQADAEENDGMKDNELYASVL